MPTRLSETLGITTDDLGKVGVYDAMIDYDSRLHIDPALLRQCNITEFNNSVSIVTSYFNNVLKLLRLSKRGGDALWKAAVGKLTFGEGLNTGLGYSKIGTGGSGIGPRMAERIADTVKEIVDAGTVDPAIFELVPVFEFGIGPDRISDMISKILENQFHAYTKRIAEILSVQMPVDQKGRRMVFVPKILLSDLPVSEQWEDVQIAAAYNQTVRDSINTVIGNSWKKLAGDRTKEEIKTMILKHPELLQELLALYKKRSGQEYDFQVDHMGLMIWDVLGPAVASQHPLNLSHFASVTSDNILDIVLRIGDQFKKLLEHNGLNEHLYDSNDERRPERFPQLLFYAIADTYLITHNLDLNREINSGSGALDFKISQGKSKVNLEIKYSSNLKLVEGFDKQLPAYNSSEGIGGQHSVYLIIRVNDNNDHKIQVIRETIADRIKRNIATPSLIVVDAIIKPTASKR